MSLLTRARSRFPYSQFLPTASYPYPSEGGQNKNHNHRKLTKLIMWITALSNPTKLWALPCKARCTGRGGEFWQNVVHWRRDWQITPAFLLWELHEKYEKAKIYDTERWSPRSVGEKWSPTLAQSCPTLCNPMDCGYQAPLSMGFSRQEYWSGVPLPSLRTY